MAYRGSYIKIEDFSGGYCGNKPKTAIKLNEALSLNDVVLNNNTGFYNRPGHRSLNNTEFGSGTNFVNGVGFNSDYGVQAIRSGKFFTASTYALDGSTTFTDSTGAYGGITSSDLARWTLFEMTGKVIGFGGVPSSPDAPIKWTGSGNVAALGGSSPSAAWGLSANNRAFAFRTSANPAMLYWSILGDPTDWAGVGSGSVNVGTVDENSSLRAVVQLNNESMLAFKRDKIYLISLVSAPFSSRLLFNGVGTLWPDSVVVINGVAYFITPDLRMKATDGDRIIDFPDNAQDILATANYQGDGPTYFPGTRLRGGNKGIVFDWVVWSNLTTIDSSCYATAWDLINKCWLKINNFPFTCFSTNQSTGTVFAGSRSTGRIKAVMFAGNYGGEGSQVYLDYEGSSTSNISPVFKGGWINTQNRDKNVQLSRIGVSGHSESAAGNATVALSNNFFGSSTWSQTFSLPLGNANLQEIQIAVPTGIRGNAVQFSITLAPSASTGYIFFDSLSLGIKNLSQTAISAREWQEKI